MLPCFWRGREFFIMSDSILYVTWTAYGDTGVWRLIFVQETLEKRDEMVVFLAGPVHSFLNTTSWNVLGTYTV